MIRLTFADGRSVFLAPHAIDVVMEADPAQTGAKARSVVCIASGMAYAVTQTAAEVADMIETALAPMDLTGSAEPLIAF